MASPTQYPEEVVLPTSYLLSQVASSVKSRAPAATTKISCRTTWMTALQTAQRSLEQQDQQQDQQLVIFPKQTKERQQALKEMALSMRYTPENVPYRTSYGRTTTSENASSRTSDSRTMTSENASSGTSDGRTTTSENASSRTSDGLPIRTDVPRHQLPPRSSPAVRERLRELAKENMAFSNRQPYHLQVPAGITERVLPVVSGTLTLRGLDGDSDDECKLDLNDMLWDTGAHGCTITVDILPSKFQTYLQSSEHDPYRDASGLHVQVDGYLALTNASVNFNTVFNVRLASSLPNGRSGVILGQSGFLNRMVWTSIPRIVLEMRGEDVGDNFWGDIHLSEHVDVVGTRRTF